VAGLSHRPSCGPTSGVQTRSEPLDEPLDDGDMEDQRSTETVLFSQSLRCSAASVGLTRTVFGAKAVVGVPLLLWIAVRVRTSRSLPWTPLLAYEALSLWLIWQYHSEIP
jgi:hypothetical protein